jgi:hypothetical protein
VQCFEIPEPGLLCLPNLHIFILVPKSFSTPNPSTSKMLTRAKVILGLAPAAPVASKPEVVNLADTTVTTETTPTPKLPIEEIFGFPVVVSSY